MIYQEAWELAKRLEKDIPSIVKLTDTTFVSIYGLLCKLRDDFKNKRISLKSFFSSEVILKHLIESAPSFLGTPIVDPFMRLNRRFVLSSKDPLQMFSLGEYETQEGSRTFNIAFKHGGSLAATADDPYGVTVLGIRHLWYFIQHATTFRASARIYGLIAHETYHGFQTESDFPLEDLPKGSCPYYCSSGEITARAFEIAATMFYYDRLKKISLIESRPSRLSDFLSDERDSKKNNVFAEKIKLNYLDDKKDPSLKKIFIRLVADFKRSFETQPHDLLTFDTPPRLFEGPPTKRMQRRADVGQLKLELPMIKK